MNKVLYDVKIDVSEHLRFLDKVSVLALATDDGEFVDNVVLHPRVKKRINHYAGCIERVHAIMAYYLLIGNLDKISSVQLCIDVSKVKLWNSLNLLFKDVEQWEVLTSTESVKIKPVKNSFVDKYAKTVRKKEELHKRCLEQEEIEEKLLLFCNNDEEKKKQGSHELVSEE